jgi:hypothetical protein
MGLNAANAAKGRNDILVCAVVVFGILQFLSLTQHNICSEVVIAYGNWTSTANLICLTVFATNIFNQALRIGYQKQDGVETLQSFYSALTVNIISLVSSIFTYHYNWGIYCSNILG